MVFISGDQGVKDQRAIITTGGERQSTIILMEGWTNQPDHVKTPDRDILGVL
jgi:hypothetical protein